MNDRKNKNRVSDPLKSPDPILTSYIRIQLALCTKALFDKLFPKEESEDPEE